MSKMSYARWSNSCWYAFYNVNGKLSLWYDMQHTFDIDFEDCKEMTVEKIVEIYNCTEEQAEEAMKYVASFLEDYDPKDGEEYEKELSEFLKKLNDKDYELGTLEDAVEFARKRNGL
jgi:hypothetical protein